MLSNRFLDHQIDCHEELELMEFPSQENHIMVSSHLLYYKQVNDLTFFMKTISHLLLRAFVLTHQESIHVVSFGHGSDNICIMHSISLSNSFLIQI